MMRKKMLTGWCYNVENMERAKRIIDNMNLNLHIEEDFAERTAWIVGSEEEIEILFANARA